VERTLAETLPCATCPAACCGPVPISAPRLARILAYLRTLPRREIKRLMHQEREPLVCHFVDTATYRCSIYELRPQVCQMYGHTEGLECPKVGHLVQILPADEVKRRMRMEVQEKIVMDSTDFRWQTVLKKTKN
jgi:Fe-S-cluster containining protein